MITASSSPYFTQSRGGLFFLNASSMIAVHSVWAGPITSITNIFSIFSFSNFCAHGPAQYCTDCIGCFPSEFSSTPCPADLARPRCSSYMCCNSKKYLRIRLNMNCDCSILSHRLSNRFPPYFGIYLFLWSWQPIGSSILLKTLLASRLCQDIRVSLRVDGLTWLFHPLSVHVCCVVQFGFFQRVEIFVSCIYGV